MTDPARERQPDLARTVINALAKKGLTGKITSSMVVVGTAKVPLSTFEADFEAALANMVRVAAPKPGPPIFDSKPAYFHVVRTQERMGPTPYYVEIQERSG